MNLWSREDKGELVLMLDISSGSTAGTLVRKFKEGLPVIIENVRTPFFLSGKPETDSLEGSMLASLSVTLSNLNKAVVQEGSVSQTIAAFSSPWIHSHLKTVIVERDFGFVFDRKSLQKIMEEEKELFLGQMKESFQEQVKIFESTVTNLYLNGYEATDVTDEKVKKVELSFLTSAISENLLSKVEDTILKSVGTRKISTHSFMFSFFKVLSHSFHNLHSALLLNMTSELTDTLFLRHGNSALTGSLPFGPASVGRKVAEKLGLQEAVAYSYLSLFASGSFDQETTEAVDKVLLEVEEDWNMLWRSMGESIPEGAGVPYSIFLIVPQGFERIMKTFLAEVFEGKNIILLGETNTFTKELVKFNDKQKDIKDENLLILASFSNLVK